ncbi:MAG TPA: hypothetical protein VMT60_03005, partial [Candidatus Bathyarchaeia archaeon]|nr:hypothetical protein [Candidatus Bathyarchaeia archaeon]
LSVAGGGTDALIYRVVSTGRDTGTVSIPASIPWHDMNDGGRSPATASGSGSVHVKPPSGLRIISVTSDAPNNALYPNTSVVDAGQVFNLTVRVENTGGDDLDSVRVRAVSDGPSHVAIVGDSVGAIPSRSQKDYVFSVTAAPAAGTEILSTSITYAVSKNTGQRVIPAQAVESIENLRIELAALLSCGVSITAPAGAIDDTLSTGQSFVATALVTNEGQAVVDTVGEVTLTLPPSIHLASGTDPLVKRFKPGHAFAWTLVAPVSPSHDTVRVRISGVPNDLNRAAPAALHIGQSLVALRTEAAAHLSACAVSITVPQGAVDGTLSTEQNFVARSVFTPSANADSVWVELTVPAGFSLTGDRTKYIGRGNGTPQTVDWLIKAPLAHTIADTLVSRAGGRDRNVLAPIPTCRSAFPVHVQQKPGLSLFARISGPAEARDGVVSTDMQFTVMDSVTKTGEAPIDTTGARVELVLPAGQGYSLDGPAEHYRKPLYPGQNVTWNIRAPGSPTSPSNIEVRFVEPYATDVNTNAACDIAAGDVFIPVQTTVGSVRLSNISREDTIPPYVVPRGAKSVPIMRMVFRNNSSNDIGLDTLHVAVKDGRGNRLANPSRSIAAVSLVAGGATFPATVSGVNPVAIVVAHGIQVPHGESDTLLMRADVATGAPAGEMRFEIEHSSDVFMTINVQGGGLGA